MAGRVEKGIHVGQRETGQHQAETGCQRHVHHRLAEKLQDDLPPARATRLSDPDLQCTPYRPGCREVDEYDTGGKQDDQRHRSNDCHPGLDSVV